jgi:hypothetical protein
LHYFVRLIREKPSRGSFQVFHILIDRARRIREPAAGPINSYDHSGGKNAYGYVGSVQFPVSPAPSKDDPGCCHNGKCGLSTKGSKNKPARGSPDSVLKKP